MKTLRDRTLAAIGREEREIEDFIPALHLANRRVLIAGASGSIGKPLTERLRNLGVLVTPTDIDPAGGPFGCVRMDITDFTTVMEVVNFYDPGLIINLAAAKLAPQGETNPWSTLDVSINGLKNLLDMGRRTLHVSTCKAADPEVAYGAGKLAAEKLAVSYGATIVRLYNVPEAGPSMLTIWDEIPEDEPLPVVADCFRYYLTLREALNSIIVAATLPTGRYAADPGASVNTAVFAAKAFPGRQLNVIHPRRGDRISEPLAAACESVLPVRHASGMNQIISLHDPGVRS